MKPRGKVFISYRRKGGAEMARLVRERLQDRGYDVFMDVEDLRSGLFNTALLQHIESCTDVVVILTPNSIEGCSRKDDWLRLEVAHAIKCKKNVVPVKTRGFQWPSIPLPQEIRDLLYLQGVEPSHEYFNASIDKLTSLFVGAPRSRFTKSAWASIISAIILVTLSVLYIATKLPIDRTAKKSSENNQLEIREAIKAVVLEDNTVTFEKHNDRDTKGLVLAYFGSPKRTYYEDVNSSQVWKAFLSFHNGLEVDPLLEFLLSAANNERDKCKALYLLKESMINIKNATGFDTILARIAGLFEETPAIRKAALSLFETSPYFPEEKWALLSQRLKHISAESYGDTLRVIWKWIPSDEKAAVCKNLLNVFSHTRNHWAACDLAYAMRKLECTQLLPEMREELALTLSPHKAWYIARLIEDFEDRDAGPALRAAFSRYKNYIEYSPDIAEILFHIEGDSSLPFIVRTSLYGPPELAELISKSLLIGKQMMMRELTVITKKGTEEERHIAGEVIERLKDRN